MTSIKTIVATAVIGVGGTVAAFTGLHLGQSPADAASAQPAKAQATHTVTLTAKDLTKLAAMMSGQQTRPEVRATTHHKQQARHERQATRRAATHTSYASSGSYSGGSGTTHHDSSGTHDCDGYSHSGTHDGSHAGDCGGACD